MGLNRNDYALCSVSLLIRAAQILSVMVINGRFFQTRPRPGKCAVTFRSNLVMARLLNVLDTVQ